MCKKRDRRFYLVVHGDAVVFRSKSITKASMFLAGYGSPAYLVKTCLSALDDPRRKPTATAMP